MRAKVYVLAGIGVWVAALTLSAAPARDDDHKRGDDDSRVQEGFEMAPVHLDLHGKDRALVGLGSYLVNAIGDCNGCHSGPSGQFAAGGDPFQGQPKQVNQAAYLSGGTPLFGPFFIPRNLTPDKTGRAEGGASFEEFKGILRTGVDPDHAHPQFGPFLQVMPWPAFQNMTDHDIRAIYEYLSAVPCIEGDPGLPNPRPIGTRCQ
jgi:hypothetical protein